MTSFKTISKSRQNLTPFAVAAALTFCLTIPLITRAADVPPATLVQDVAGSKDPAPLLNKTAQFSIRTVVNACTGSTAPAGMSCTIDTLLVAKAIDNGDLIWERQLFSRVYEADKPLESQMILVKNMKFIGGKSIEVRNARGDTFTVEIGHGHLKSPKSPRVYKK